MDLTRRKFLRYSGATGVAIVTGYSLWEARDLQIASFTLPIQRLPDAFAGARISMLADLHHGPYLSREYIREVVAKTNALEADLTVLVGDYVYRRAKYIPAVMEELGRLTAPLGVFAVRGNHDNNASPAVTSQELARNGLRELTNTGTWLNRGDGRLWLAGVDDLATGFPNVAEALGETPATECAILLSHNPDVAETLKDPRVSLVLSGHTHGGQVRLPLIGAPIVPSSYGQKYLYGPTAAPHTLAFTTRGVGTIFPPVRLNCPPEIALLTLVPA